jgi:ADP-heptose:LPS heptosyltransferase
VRVLLLRVGALGDLLLLRPGLAALRGAGHRVALIAPEQPASVLRRELDELFAWERPELAALLAGGPNGALSDLLRRSDRVVAFTRSEPLASALAAAGAPLRCHDPSPPHGRHAAEWLAEGVRDLAPLGIPVSPPLVPSAQEQEAAAVLLDRLPQGFVAVHPGSGSPSKNWPRERFLGLIERLSGRHSFLVVRGPADTEACAELAADARAVVAHELPLGVLGCLLSRAGVFVGNDSGVSHLAAAFGAPTLALFGPTDPAAWRPLGARVRVLASKSGATEGLDVAAVVAAAHALLATSGRALPSG